MLVVILVEERELCNYRAKPRSLRHSQNGQMQKASFLCLFVLASWGCFVA